MKKKIFVIEDIDSVWLKLFIEHYLLPLGHDIYVYNYKTKPKYDEFYKSNGIKYIEYDYTESFISKIPRINSAFRWLAEINTIRKQYSFDKIVVISVTIRKVLCAKYGIKASKDIVLYYTGSDILRLDSLHGLIIKKLTAMLNPMVVFGSKKLRSAYVKKIGEAGDAPIIHFSSDTFDQLEIIKSNYSLQACRQELNIPPDKISICIGYNAWKSQQHIKVIKALKRLPADLKSKLIILLPMTYCQQEKYISDVRAAVRNSSIDAIFLTSYLTPTQLYMLRLSTDIFINSQTTDSLSISVLETYCAGGYILSGSWLEYPDVEEIGIEYDKFNSFDDLYEKTLEVLKKEVYRKIDNSIVNRDEQKLKELFSVKTSSKKWESILNKQ